MGFPKEPILVTGGLGFIGSNLVEKLLSQGKEVHIIDKSKKSNHLRENEKHSQNLVIHNVDLLNFNLGTLPKFGIIYHLAADPEVRLNITNPKSLFDNNIQSTFQLLDGIKENPPDKFVFTSSSTVYGEAKTIPTPETYSPLEPISIYGASKLACESLICSYSYTYGFNSLIFRLANIIGPYSTHGVIFDFFNKLKQDKKSLEILGDGKQEKSYVHIDDCVSAMNLGISKVQNPFEILNIGSDDSTTVKTIAEEMLRQLDLPKTDMKFTGGVDGGRGWKGDIKNMRLDIQKLKSMGWTPKHSSYESVKLTIKSILKYNQSNGKNNYDN